MTKDIKKKINGVNSKMLSQITRRSIHEEAKYPSFNILRHILHRRWTYLGHILRLEKNRLVRRYLLELSPGEAPFIPGSLLDDTDFKTAAEAIEAASDRNGWKELWKKRDSVYE